MPEDIEVTGDTEVETRLKDVGDRAADVKPAMKKIRSIIEGGFKKNFESGGSYLGESWRPLAPGTLARKARLNEGSKPMVASGALERALTGGTGRRGGATKTQARAGIATKLYWSRFAQQEHSTGEVTAGKGAKLPKRTLVGLAKRDKIKSFRTIEKYVLTGEIFP